jgi:magnesium-transporting ATPase (P-type)
LSFECFEKKMAPHGHGEDGGGHGSTNGLDLTVDPAEREGLTTEQVEELYKKWGFNELPVIEIPLWWVFLEQYMGTMPYMLELAIVIAGAVQDWIDFGIILAMVSAKQYLVLCGFLC